MNNPKIDFGESRWMKTNPDPFGQSPFIPAPDPIQPRPPGTSQPAEVRNDELLRQEMAAFQLVREEQTEIIRQHTAAIRDAEAKIQVAPDKAGSDPGLLA
jgi:hypothetical protein